jgi:hypothetical protein
MCVFKTTGDDIAIVSDDAWCNKQQDPQYPFNAKELIQKHRGVFFGHQTRT